LKKNSRNVTRKKLNRLGNLRQKKEKEFRMMRGRKSSPIRRPGKSIFQRGSYLFACQFIVKVFV